MLTFFFGMEGWKECLWWWVPDGNLFGSMRPHLVVGLFLLVVLSCRSFQFSRSVVSQSKFRSSAVDEGSQDSDIANKRGVERVPQKRRQGGNRDNRGGQSDRRPYGNNR